MATERELQVVVTAKDEASAKMKGIGDSIQGGLKKVAIAAGVAGAALGVLVYKSVTGLADLGEELDNVSKSTGASAGALSSFKMVAEGMGSSLDAVTTTMRKMQDNTMTALSGNKQMADSFKALGLNAKELSTMKPEGAFMKIGNAISGVTDPMQRTALAMNVAGKGMGELIPMFDGGTASLDGFAKSAKEAGLYMDEMAMQKALALDEAMDKLKATMGGVTQSIALALAPAITDLLIAATPLIEKITAWISEHPQLTGGIIATTAAVLGLLVFLPLLVSGIGAVGTVLAFVAANPIVLIIAAIAALVAAIAFLIANWDLVKAKVIEVWQAMQDWITEKILAIQNAVSGFWTKVKEVWTGGLDAISKAWSDTWNGISSFVTGILGTISTLIDNTIGRIQGAIESVKNLASAAGSGIMAAGSAVKAGFVRVGQAVSGAHNATGGNVYAGQTSMVGEHGAEMVTFGRGGRVIPNNRLGGGSTNVTIILKDNTLLSDSQDVAVKIGDLIMDRLRLQTRLA